MNNKKLLFVPFVIGFLFSGFFGFGQACPCTVNAGPDKNLCEPGGTVQLNGSFTGNPILTEWTPSTGLSNPLSLTPTATVSETTTYTLNIKCVNNTNLVNNSNFNQGNTSFTSDYTYSATDLVPEGIYTVTTNPQLVHPGFAPCADHTGGGQMMVINGAGNPDENVWCQTISIKANTEYAFETWVASVVAANPALLQFSINGQTIGPIFQAPGNTCQWVQFTSTWFSGSATSATICIVNQNTALGGNDFALDDISFKEVCQLKDEVTIYVNPNQQTYKQATICQGQTYILGGKTFQNEGTYDLNFKTWKGCDSIVTLDLAVIEVNAEIDPPYKLDCGLTEVTLFGDKSSYGSYFTYHWTTTGGHIISDPNQISVDVDQPGKYTLTVTYNDGSIICSQTSSVTVETDYKKPIISAGKDGLITCADTTLRLHGSSIDPKDNFLVSWTTPNGTIIGKKDTLDPLAGGVGLYIMKITSNYNGCSGFDTVFVDKDPSLPKVVIDGNHFLNCNQTEIWLNANNSDSGPPFTFSWSTSGGKFDTATDSLGVKVSTPGQYLLTVVNSSNGCKSSASFNIIQDVSKPLVDAGAPDTLSCAVKNIKLFGSTDIPDSLALISWTTLNGSFVSGWDSLSPIIKSTGIYFLQVQNKSNGCISKDSVMVSNDVNTPKIINLQDATLNCIQTQLILDATGSSSGPNYIYNWTSPSGNIIGKTDSLIVMADKPGLYFFEVSNISNGCITKDSLLVSEDIALPKASAGADQTILCTKSSLSLDGTSSETSPKITYQWTTLQGNIQNGANTLNPQINKPGIYYIQVINTINGCKSKDSVLVGIDTIHPVLMVPADVTITCLQPEISILASNLSGAGNFNYNWTTNNGFIVSGTQSLNPLVNKPGSYLLSTTNTDNGCISTQSVNVISNEELPIALAGSDTSLSCKNPTIILNGSFNYKNPGNLKINWTPAQNVISGGNALNPEIASAGTYLLTVKDSITGCIGTDEVLINLDTISPLSSISPVIPLTCINTLSVISLQVTNVSWGYQWSSTNGNIIGPDNGSSVSADKSGKYDVSIVDANNGCKSNYSVLLTSDQNPPIVNAGPDMEITCTKSEVDLTATIQGGVLNKVISWVFKGQAITGGQGLIITTGIPGTYFFNVMDESNGCTSIDSVNVSENTNKPSAFDAELTPPGCTIQGTINIQQITGGVPPYTYSLNGGAFQTSEIFQSVKSGNYSLTIKDANGCEFADQLTVPEPLPLMVDLPQLVTIEYGDSHILEPILNIPDNQIQTIEWKPTNGLSCSDCLNPLASPLLETWYTLTLSDFRGCTASAKVKLLVLKDFNLYVPNAFSPDGNGINDRWQIFGDLKKVVKIKKLEIFDRWGESLFQENDFPVNDPDYGWDGKYRGKYLDPAVFVYYFEAEFVDGSTKLYKGDINLVR